MTKDAYSLRGSVCIYCPWVWIFRQRHLPRKAMPPWISRAPLLSRQLREKRGRVTVQRYRDEPPSPSTAASGRVEGSAAG